MSVGGVESVNEVEMRRKSKIITIKVHLAQKNDVYVAVDIDICSRFLFE